MTNGFPDPPSTISEAAQAMLAMLAQLAPRLAGKPALDDKQGWQDFLATSDASLAQQLSFGITSGHPEAVDADYGGVPSFESTIADADPGVVFYLHGGGLVMGGGEVLRLFARMNALNLRRRIVAPDYGNPPDHPFPAAIDDCIAAYKALVETVDPRRVAIVGASGGGNLAILLPLKLKALGLPYPACVGVLTPEVDMTESGDSFTRNLGVDPVLRTSLGVENALYANGQDLCDPDISPLFADFPADYPPTWIQAGTRDLFLSNAVLLHRALRRRAIPAELHIWEAMPHGGFGGSTPEDAELYAELRDFIGKYVKE